jgi:hypothetical protein
MTKLDLVEFYNELLFMMKSEISTPFTYHSYQFAKTLDQIEITLKRFRDRLDDYILSDLEFIHVMYMRSLNVEFDTSKVDLYPYYVNFLRNKKLNSILNG